MPNESETQPQAPAEASAESIQDEQSQRAARTRESLEAVTSPSRISQPTKEQRFAELKQRVDVAQIFITFMTLVGDVERVALACEREPEFISWLAEQEGWVEKIRRVSSLAKGGKPGDWERAQNRALNFVQCHRIRILIDRLVGHLYNISAEELALKMTTQPTKSGTVMVSGRFFADIMSALDKVHALSYQALGDSIGERVQRATEEGSEHSPMAIHAAVLRALDCPSVSNDTTLLLEAEVHEAIPAVQPERAREVERVVDNSDGPKDE